MNNQPKFKINNFQVSNLLGEGPMWSEQQQALYWVDIIGCQLHCLQAGIHQFWQFDKKISAVVESEQGKLLLALANGVAYFDLNSRQLGYLCKLDEDLPSNRTNDAKVSPLGDFWVGTMNDDEENGNVTGRLWKVKADGSRLKMLDNIAISNTLAWDLKREKFYFADSAKRIIYHFDYHKNGMIDNQEVFINTPDGIYPDGSCIDADGFLWNCQWDGWQIVRYAPDGSVDLTIDLPVQRPTCCVFGGENYTTLYITSAKVGLSETALAQQPLAGDILSIELSELGVNTCGRASYKFCD